MNRSTAQFKAEIERINAGHVQDDEKLGLLEEVNTLRSRVRELEGCLAVSQNEVSVAANEMKRLERVVTELSDENATLNEDLRIISQSRRDEATKTQLEDKYRRALVYIDCLQSKLGPASAPLSRRNFPLTNSNKIRGN